jgi:hypothetical protein
MTRFRDLPGGIDRAAYCWPMLTVIHPEHGAYRMDVHCVRNPDNGSRVLDGVRRLCETQFAATS